ncbi:hypothetical protein R0135_13565 [Congregibacter variabilis]|uniref:DUF4189 domain-containing protein n=1 Tax=Congregibacter variabilis TaxID=3081200 RepID=A0ABZ0I2P7_9GAMM|nr:hypothetical protein R0135_13565 [Congregibacter sp. IMCC43200]
MRGCNGAGTLVPRQLLLNTVCLLASSVLVTGSLSQSVLAQTEPYSYYGGDIESEAKNAAIEACEYRVLVEEQRCNRRANKSACIKEVHSECREKHSDESSKESNQEEK